MSLDPKLEKEIENSPDDVISVVITADYNVALETALEEICVDTNWLGERQMGFIAARVPASKVKALQKVKGVLSVELDDTYTIQEG